MAEDVWHVRCPECGHDGVAHVWPHGKKVRCATCGHRFLAELRLITPTPKCKKCGASIPEGPDMCLECMTPVSRKRESKNNLKIAIGSAVGLVLVAIIAFIILSNLGYVVEGVVIGVMGVSVLVVAYLLPSLVAIERKHPQTGPIVVINLLLGWTIVGWALCLAYAIWNVEGTSEKRFRM